MNAWGWSRDKRASRRAPQHASVTELLGWSLMKSRGFLVHRPENRRTADEFAPLFRAGVRGAWPALLVGGGSFALFQSAVGPPTNGILARRPLTWFVSARRKEGYSTSPPRQGESVEMAQPPVQGGQAGAGTTKPFWLWISSDPSTTPGSQS